MYNKLKELWRVKGNKRFKFVVFNIPINGASMRKQTFWCTQRLNIFLKKRQNLCLAEVVIGSRHLSWACAGFVTAGCWRIMVCVQVERSERSERSVLTAWGPGARSRAPGGVQGQRPGGGPGGQSPRKLLGFQGFSDPKTPLLALFFFYFKDKFFCKIIWYITI